MRLSQNNEPTNTRMKNNKQTPNPPKTQTKTKKNNEKKEKIIKNMTKIKQDQDLQYKSKLNRKNKDKLKKKKQEKTQIKKDIKKIEKQLAEFEYYNTKISEIFDYDPVKDSEREFTRSYNQLDFLPEEIAKFMKNLKKDFDKTINHIRRNDIPKTNNLLEGFFKITFPKKYKRRFRTEKKGVKNYLRHMRIQWYERNVLHKKITT